MDDSSLDFETRATRAGLGMQVGDTISTVPPIDASTTFTYPSIEGVHAALGPQPEGFAYARNANPTVVALEKAMASLEGAQEVVAFGSGMAAVHGALVGIGLEAGDTILSSANLYGVTRSLFAQLAGFDIQTRFVDILDLAAVEEALAGGGVRALYLETITNPLLKVPDLRSLVDLARARRVPTIVDNTFATPYLFRPLELGVDVVLHSATKYIAGHGDVMAGLVATGASYGQRIRAARTTAGAILSPFDAWLTLRGVRTLPLRMARHAESAMEVACWLVDRPWVERVYYPGLRSHAQHEIASRQFDGRFGGMVAFDLAAGRDQVLAFIDSLHLVTKGTSLGDVESLILYPPLSSHRGLTPAELDTAGIGDGLVRLSVGLESPRDLCADLERAAEEARLPRRSSPFVSDSER